MKNLELAAKVGKDGTGPSFKGHIKLGENLQELQEQFTPDVVYAHARASIIVAAQGAIRAKMSGKEPVTDQKALQKFIDEWQPGSRAPGVPAAEKAKTLLQKLSPEERKQLLKEMAAQR